MLLAVATRGPSSTRTTQKKSANVRSSSNEPPPGPWEDVGASRPESSQGAPQTQGYGDGNSQQYQTQGYTTHSQQSFPGQSYNSQGDASQPAFQLSSQDFVLTSSQDELYRYGDVWGAGP